MDDADAIPSISNGAVGSRFISQDDLERAQATRDEQWKAAYARLGQEPPPMPKEDTAFDGRSLYEKLQSQKIAREEAWQEQHKLSKQFRALEDDEIRFLEQINQKRREEEQQREQEDSVELAGFREAVAARSVLPPPPVLGAPASQAPKSISPPNRPAGVQSRPNKKDQKSLLKGVVVKKVATKKISNIAADEPDAKRRRIS